MVAFAKWAQEQQEKGASQEELAQRLGTTQGHMSRLIAGKCKPGRKLANAIQREAGIPQAAWDEPERPRKAAPVHG